MKKKILLIYSWIIVSIVAQVLAYMVIDKIYLGNRKNVAGTMKITTVTSNEESPEIVEEPEHSIAIPAGAENIRISYDGTYAAYLLDKKLNIVEIATNNTKKVIDNYFVNKENPQSKVEANITSFQWIQVSGKNTITYALSSTNGSPVRAQVLIYDADTGNEHIGVTLYENYVPRGGEIRDIVISPLTMVYYAKIKINDSQDRLIRFNIMDEVSPSITLNAGTTTKIGYFSEDLYYEDANNKISVKSGFKNPYQLQTEFRAALIGLVGAYQGGKDKIYIGQLNNDNKVEKIYYGIQGTDTASWKDISPSQPVMPEDIIVKGEGMVYIINHKEGTLYEIGTGAKVSINGKYIDIVNDHIVYLDGGNLKLKPLKKGKT